MGLTWRDGGSVLLIALAFVSLAKIHESLVDRFLRSVETTRVELEARHALEGEIPEGQLTIVRETESEKYPFLNKKRYVHNSVEPDRVDTPLTAEEDADKARADRHSLARRSEGALTQRFDDGRVRATVADGLRSAELNKVPSPLAIPHPWGTLTVALLIALLAAAISRRFMSSPVIPTIIGLTALLVTTVLSTKALLLGAERIALDYLSVGGFSAKPPELGMGLFVAAQAVVIAVYAGLGAFILGPLGSASLARLQRDRGAYLAIAPAMIGLLVLVGIPFAVGMGLSLFEHRHGTFTFVGMSNFVDIVSGTGESWFSPQTLPYSLVITIVWTALNVSLHVSFGLMLALLLYRRASGLSKIYRVILIIPWAVPAYLTALIWRSMFDADIGVINRFLGTEGMSWMHDTATAFFANLVTNVWLGVPFMMVVCLGALTSIPDDLYEAAKVDGATRFQELFHITLPLLKPALLPALILGSIWTFNKFEVIYLVSEGRPDGATDILVTESYRWAFERGLAQGGAYGYAAAYSVIIFIVLLVYGWMTSRVAKRAEEALR